MLDFVILVGRNELEKKKENKKSHEQELTRDSSGQPSICLSDLYKETLTINNKSSATNS